MRLEKATKQFEKALRGSQKSVIVLDQTGLLFIFLGQEDETTAIGFYPITNQYF